MNSYLGLFILISLSAVMDNSSEEGTITKFSGSNVSFFFPINPDFKLHVAKIKHKSNEVGYYVPSDSRIFLNEGYQGRYSIDITTSGLQLNISNVQKKDEGIFVCTINYEKKPRKKYRRRLEIQEKVNSITFVMERNSSCSNLKCNAESWFVEVKKQGNKIQEGQDIELNSCEGSLDHGEYSCCLVENHNTTECKTINFTEEGQPVINDWMKVAVIVIVALVVIVVLVVVVALYIFLRKKKCKQEDTSASKKDTENGKKADMSGCTKDAKDDEEAETSFLTDNENKKEYSREMSFADTSGYSTDVEGEFVLNLPPDTEAVFV